MTKRLRLNIQFFATQEDLLSPQVTVRELESKMEELPVYPGEALFPDGEKQYGLNLEFIKGAGGLPVELAPSEFDARAPIRDRVNIEGFSEKMPIFRDSHKLTEEELRNFKIAEQAASTGNDGMKSALAAQLRKVYNDRLDLDRGAHATKERMRMQLLSTGKIGIAANDQVYDFDYGLKDNQLITATADEAFSNPDADVFALLDKAFDAAADNGAVVDTAMMTTKTLSKLTKNKGIIGVITKDNAMARVSRNAVKELLEGEYGVNIILNDHKYRKRDDYSTATFFPDDVISFFPSGALGEMVFSYTTEELALGGKDVDLATMSSGMTIITDTEAHVPNQNVIGSMIALPTFEGAGDIVILNTEPAGEVAP